MACAASILRLPRRTALPWGFCALQRHAYKQRPTPGLPSRLCCAFGVSRPPDALFRLPRCGLVSCRCRTWASAFRGFPRPVADRPCDRFALLAVARPRLRPRRYPDLRQCRDPCRPRCIDLDFEGVSTRAIRCTYGGLTRLHAPDPLLTFSLRGVLPAGPDPPSRCVRRAPRLDRSRAASRMNTLRSDTHLSGGSPLMGFSETPACALPTGRSRRNVLLVGTP